MHHNNPTKIVKICMPLFVLSLIIPLISVVWSDTPKNYKLSPLGVKSWTEIHDLSLPEEGKGDILYKSNALYALQNPHQRDHMLGFSENGRYKVTLRSLADPEEEDMGIATIFDSLDRKIWEDTVGWLVRLSNNGDDFISKGRTAGYLWFHKISTGNATFDKRAPSGYAGRYGFSNDGRYFVGAGTTIDLITADGQVVWRKTTNCSSSRVFAFNKDASRIAVAIMPSLGDFREPVITDLNSTVNARLLDVNDRTKSYIFILDQTGKVLHKIVLNSRFVRLMSFSPEGQFLAVKASTSLYFFDVKTGGLLWEYPFPSDCAHVTSMVFSGSSELLAIAGVTCRMEENSDRFIYLLNKKGELIDSARVDDKFPTGIAGPTLSFNDSGDVLLAGTPKKLYAFQLLTK